MYGIITIPSVGFQWIVDPLYKLILNGGKFEISIFSQKSFVKLEKTIVIMQTVRTLARYQ